MDIASRNASVRVIVLAANGPTYCAGHDLKEITAGRTAPDMGHEYFSYIMNMCSNAMQAIVTCKNQLLQKLQELPLQLDANWLQAAIWL